MCKPMSQGGQRCAAHTRPAFEAATAGTAAWDDAAAAYAATPSGRNELTRMRDQAAEHNDLNTEAACDAALRRAENAHQVATETVERLNSNPTGAGHPALPVHQDPHYAFAPNTDVFTPHIATDDHGNHIAVYVATADNGPSNHLAVYVATADNGPSNHPLQTSSVLDTYNVRVLNDESIPGSDTTKRAVTEWIATELDNNMERIVLLKRTGSNPAHYTHTTLSNDFYDNGGDEDDFKAYDAAIILPTGYTGNDDNGFVADLNHEATGRTHTVVVQRTSPTGQHLITFTDDYDGTLADPDDAQARAEAYATGNHGTWDDIFNG